MEINSEEILKAAKESKLNISQEQAIKLAMEIGIILSCLNKTKNATGEEIEYPLGKNTSQDLRKDQPISFREGKNLLAARAPLREGYLELPRIL